MTNEKTVNDPALENPSATWPIQQNVHNVLPTPSNGVGGKERSHGPAEQNPRPSERSS
jgi:hypothetical protein